MASSCWASACDDPLPTCYSLTVSTTEAAPVLSFGECRQGRVCVLCMYLLCSPVIADSRHSFLSDRLNDSGYVKATDVNKLFLSCESLEQLEQAKDILARWVWFLPLGCLLHVCISQVQEEP